MTCHPKVVRWFPWALWAFVVGGTLVLSVFTFDDPGVRKSPFVFANAILNGLFPITFGLVGALILWRQPRNTIGWLLMFVALWIVVIGLLDRLLKTLASASAQLDLATWLYLWETGWTWWGLIAPLLLIVLLFPTGRLLSPRWRWVVVALAFVIVSFMVMATFSATLTDPVSGNTVSNPLGVIPESVPFEVFYVPFAILFLTAVGFCVASVFVRYRRASSLEREQLKWFLSACAVFLVIYSSGFVVEGASQDEAPGVWAIVFDLTILAIPLSIGIAILRYRLWDIDILIRRTVTYALVAALLAVVYFGSVILLQQLFAAVTGERSEVITVLSTLVIAALFVPLRNRIQGWVDRRFYRRKYDAQKVLQEFGETVRDETDLEALTGRLLEVVQETMQPRSVGLLLRTEGRRMKDEG